MTDFLSFSFHSNIYLLCTFMFVLFIRQDSIQTAYRKVNIYRSCTQTQTKKKTRWSRDTNHRWTQILINYCPFGAVRDTMASLWYFFLLNVVGATETRGWWVNIFHVDTNFLGRSNQRYAIDWHGQKLSVATEQSEQLMSLFVNSYWYAWEYSVR